MLFFLTTNHLNICFGTTHVVVTKWASMVSLCPRINTVEVIGVTARDLGHVLTVIVLAETY